MMEIFDAFGVDGHDAADVDDACSVDGEAADGRPSIQDAQALGGGADSHSSDVKFAGGCDCGYSPGTCGAGHFCRWSRG